MSGRLSKEELVILVKKIMNSEGTEAEIDEWERLVQQNVPHPEVSGLIFYPEVKMSAEEIVEVALGYRPIQLPERVDNK
jgi:hypothetical protein